MNNTIPSLHIIGGRKLGGAELFFVRLVNALARHGMEVEAVTLRGSEIDAAIEPQVVRHHAPLAGVWDIWSRMCIQQIIRKRAPAIVQTYMGRATRLTHLPANRQPVHIARLGGFYNLKGYRHAHAWVGNTRGICDYMIREGLPPERVFQIGNFVDTPINHEPHALIGLRETWSIPVDARVVLGLGRLHPNKGFSDLLQAFSRLPSSLHGQPLHLVMVGDGPLRQELKAEAVKLGLGKRVTWTGWQYDTSLWYQLADVFVCSSRHEPLGNVILEAWANSTPVVSTEAEGPMELIASEQNALLAPVAAPDQLAERILDMLQFDEARRQQISRSGISKLAEKHSEQAIISAYLEMYRKLTSK